jgi:hypothetical protein
MKTNKQQVTRVLKTLGGSGSGNFGHAGRPGEVGGSGDEGGEKISLSALLKGRTEYRKVEKLLEAGASLGETREEQDRKESAFQACRGARQELFDRFRKLSQEQQVRSRETVDRVTDKAMEAARKSWDKEGELYAAKEAAIKVFDKALGNPIE